MALIDQYGSFKISQSFNRIMEKYLKNKSCIYLLSSQDLRYYAFTSAEHLRTWFVNSIIKQVIEFEPDADKELSQLFGENYLDPDQDMLYSLLSHFRYSVEEVELDPEDLGPNDW